ncbi:MAG: ABC transporter permease [Polyangiaceae bacterium]
MRGRKVWVIARFELVSTIRRLGFLIVTFGMPLFALLYGGLAAIPTYFVTQQELMQKHLGLVDPAGVLALSPGTVLEAPRARFEVFDSEPSARRALTSDASLVAYYVLPADYLQSGTVEGYALANGSVGAWDGRLALEHVLRAQVLARQGPTPHAERIQRPVVDRQSFRVEDDGRSVPERREARVGRVVLPIGFVFLLFTSVLMSGGYLLTALATEKANKVVDVLLSSASSTEIMAGKLLGLGTAGLIQVGVWGAMTLSARLAFLQTLEPFDVRVPWQALVVSPLLFVLAYAFLGSLMLGTGSLGTNLKESHQLGMVWALLATVPLVFLPVILAAPHGTLARVLTFIPFSAPAAMVFRISLSPDGFAWWELSLALFALGAWTWVALRASARLFRIGLLLGTTRPGLWALLREAARLER